MSSSDAEITQLLREIKELQMEQLQAYKEFTSWVRADTEQWREQNREAAEC